MKRSVFIHTLFLVSFFIILSVYRHLLSTVYSSLWIGAILGSLIPAVDYLLYVYVLKPKEEVSQQINSLMAQGKTVEGISMINRTIDAKDTFMMHTANFQLAFAAFAFWAITSSNLMGRGLVLAFLLHMVIDEVRDWTEGRDLNRWFRGFVFNLTDKEKKWFVIGNIIYLLILGFIF